MDYITTTACASEHYPTAPGYRDSAPDTSREAAQRIAPLARSQRGKILAALKEALPQGRSSEQIAAATGILVYSVRARMSELVAAGEVQETDERTTNEGGFTVALWRAAK